MTHELHARRASCARMREAAALLGLVASTGCAHPQGPAAPARPPAEATARGDHESNCAERIAALEAQIVRLRREVLNSGRFDPVPAVARFRVDIVSATSDAFVLVAAQVSIDGAPLYRRSVQAGSLAVAIPAWAGVLSPGDHAVRVHLLFAGNAARSPALHARQFDLSEEHEVSLPEDHAVSLTVRAYERGDASTPYERRLAVAWDVREDATPSGSP